MDIKLMQGVLKGGLRVRQGVSSGEYLRYKVDESCSNLTRSGL